MLNVLNNQSRALLALKPIDPVWQCVSQDDMQFYHADGVLYKAIFRVPINPYSQLAYEDVKYDFIVEYDLNLPLNEQLEVIAPRGQAKTINYRYISGLRTHKLPHIKMDLTNKAALVECGVRWLPGFTFNSTDTLNQDIAAFVQSYGEKEWQKQLKLLCKSPKTRQKYAEGDIFCVSVGPNQFVYLLLIGSLMHLRKTKLWAEQVPKNHYMKSWMGIPVIYRKYDFISDRNDLAQDEITQHTLLAAEYSMDDQFMRGDYKIIGHKPLVADDIDFPISFSVHTRQGEGATTAAGMGLLANDEVENLHILQSYAQRKADVWLTLEWGIGSYRWRLQDYLAHKDLDLCFIPHSGVGWGVAGFHPAAEPKVGNALDAFGEDKLVQLLTSLGQPPITDFDAFNQAHLGLTRQAYIDYIQAN